MLKIYICPSCYNFRMVSKRTDAICLHCQKKLVPTNISFEKFSNLDLEERNKYKRKWMTS